MKQTEIFDLELPADTEPETRIAWAGERVADIADGTIDNPHIVAFLQSLIGGWLDVSDGHEREYQAILRQIKDMANDRWPRG